MFIPCRKDGNIKQFIDDGLFIPTPVAWNILNLISVKTLCTKRTETRDYNEETGTVQVVFGIKYTLYNTSIISFTIFMRIFSNNCIFL